MLSVNAMASGQGYQQFKNVPDPGHQPTETYSTPQSDTTAVLVQQPTVIIAPSPSRSFTTQILLACFTFWCCGWMFGLVAFVLAKMAEEKAPIDPLGARSLSGASTALSVAGIIFGIVAIIYVGVGLVNAANRLDPCRYQVANTCFRYRIYTASSYDCHRAHPSGTYSVDNYCYFNCSC